MQRRRQGGGQTVTKNLLRWIVQSMNTKSVNSQSRPLSSKLTVPRPVDPIFLVGGYVLEKTRMGVNKYGYA